jgi:FMN-dependent oxidoreductase (nitrilotriacetate monooxygenase family)
METSANGATRPMSESQRQMRLGAFFNPTGHHVASWRDPRSQADAGINFQHYVDITRAAERAKFDMVFLADNVCVRDASMEAISRSAQYIANFEPITLLSALAPLTSHIGLVATASTSYNEPFHVARKFASLDHISGGRAGWNLVTSGQEAEAKNFSRDKHYLHGERYERAREFAQIVVGLWDSWDDDAFVRDKDSGLFFHPDKMHVLDHKGVSYSVRGPLNVPRSPQGHPVIVQAGGSQDMIAVAAEFAEVIFCAPLTLEAAQTFYANLKGRVAGCGRVPDHVKIMPGLSAVVGRTGAEAEERYQHLQSLIHPIVAREILSLVLGNVDLKSYPLDGPFPENLPLSNASQSTFQYVNEMARNEKLTLRQVAMRVAGARGKSVVKGSPQQIADHMETWFREGGCDGFNLMPPTLPGGLDDFIELVIPELQRRGLFRTEYDSRIFRENLGLPRPVSRYATSPSVAAPPTTSLARAGST